MINYWELKTQDSISKIDIWFSESNEPYKAYRNEKWMIHYKRSLIKQWLGLNPVKVKVGPYIEMVDKNDEVTYLLLQKPNLFTGKHLYEVKKNYRFISLGEQNEIEFEDKKLAEHIFIALTKPFSKIEETVEYYGNKTMNL